MRSSDGYTADKVKYFWSSGVIQSLKLHKIRLPDFQIREAYVTSRVESYATGIKSIKTRRRTLNFQETTPVSTCASCSIEPPDSVSSN